VLLLELCICAEDDDIGANEDDDTGANEDDVEDAFDTDGDADEDKDDIDAAVGVVSGLSDDIAAAVDDDIEAACDDVIDEVSDFIVDVGTVAGKEEAADELEAGSNDSVFEVVAGVAIDDAWEMYKCRLINPFKNITILRMCTVLTLFQTAV
jgi:hypothetical protein